MTRLLLKGVSVHWHLHKRLWSVKKKGRPMKYMGSLTLVNAHFKVSEAGRRRTIRQERRNVHAWAVGDVLGPAEPDLVHRMGMIPVTYNPYRGPDFHDKLTGAHVSGALMLVMTEDGRVFACNPNN